eukprot:5397472-Pleurochrysis_carterae.AAC.1
MTALAERALQSEVAQLQVHVDSVEKNKFYFIKLSDDLHEGELRVSLARVMEDAAGPSGATE